MFALTIEYASILLGHVLSNHEPREQQHNQSWAYSLKVTQGMDQATKYHISLYFLRGNKPDTGDRYSNVTKQGQSLFSQVTRFHTHGRHTIGLHTVGYSFFHSVFSQIHR